MFIENKIYTNIVSENIATLIGQKDNVIVLEAGCGSASHIHLPQNAEITGIDVSEEQLMKNTAIKHKILGDIQIYPLPLNLYDVVVCCDVIEHLQCPIDAIINIFRSLKIGGILILSFPNLISFKGLVTKLSPYWFHVFYYNKMKISKKPFHTYFRYSIRPNNILNISLNQGFSIEYNLLYGGIPKRMESHYVLPILYRCFTKLLNLLSLNRYDFNNSECIMILKKIK